MFENQRFTLRRKKTKKPLSRERQRIRWEREIENDPNQTFKMLYDLGAFSNPFNNESQQLEFDLKVKSKMMKTFNCQNEVYPHIIHRDRPRKVKQLLSTHTAVNESVIQNLMKKSCYSFPINVNIFHHKLSQYVCTE